MSNTTRKPIYVVADIWPLPENVSDVKRILANIVPEAKKERTCLKYELCENLEDQYQLTYLHAWTSEHALDEHLQSELIVKATDELRQWLSRPMEVRRYKHIG
jgi:quinol monooxygenase YgiN